MSYVCSLLHFPENTLSYVNICTRDPQSLSSLRARKDHDPALRRPRVTVTIQSWLTVAMFGRDFGV